MLFDDKEIVTARSHDLRAQVPLAELRIARHEVPAQVE